MTIAILNPQFTEPAPAPRAVQLVDGRAPTGAVDVSATSVWASRYRIGDHVGGTPIGAHQARELHRRALLEGRLPYTPARVRAELAGNDLACECRPEDPCYRDNLLEIANDPTIR